MDNQDLNSLLGDLGDFGDLEEVTAGINEETDVVLSEDLTGFASGFPEWDLLPPSKS